MNTKNTIIFNLVLILIGGIIAGAIIFYDKNQNETKLAANKPIETKFLITPVTEADHILGNPDADIVLVEYSDFKCPYCREFHATMKRLIGEYGKTGDLAWVYRHFPREDAFKNNNSVSIIAAKASECVANILGEEKFWDYIGDIHGKLPITFTTDDLRSLAIEMGVDGISYDQCLISGKFDEKIKKSIDDGLAIYKYDPDFGTPYNIVITKSGDELKFAGSQSYSYMKEIIKQYAFPNSL